MSDNTYTNLYEEADPSIASSDVLTDPSGAENRDIAHRASELSTIESGNDVVESKREYKGRYRVSYPRYFSFIPSLNLDLFR